VSGSEFERGVKEGKDDATLASNTARLDALNGSLAANVRALDALAVTMREGFDAVNGAIRILQEEGRAAVLALEVAAQTLAKETERRRAELEGSTATTDRTWSKRERLAALALTIILSLLGFYLARRSGVR